VTNDAPVKLVYQTRGSAGRRTAKWHRTTGEGRTACSGLPIEPAKVHRIEDVAAKNLCRVCVPADPAQEG
jgi:hypothetical protein